MWDYVWRIKHNPEDTLQLPDKLRSAALVFEPMGDSFRNISQQIEFFKKMKPRDDMRILYVYIYRDTHAR